MDGTGSFTKNGAGTLTVGYVVSGNLTVNGGTLAMTPDSTPPASATSARSRLNNAKLDLATTS